MTAAWKPRLIVTVDTEEEGLWDGVFKPHGNTVRNIDGIERFQALCESFKARPTYLVDTPVADDDRAVEILKGLQDAGQCEIGAHLHPWCAPPFDEQTNQRNSFMCNLPEPLQRNKLTRLTEYIQERFARRPTSFRAGRYGLDIAGVRILQELGYRVDSSVIPFEDYSGQEGPDFRAFPYMPYRIGREDLRTAEPDGGLLEAPVSVGFSRADFTRAHRMREFAKKRVFRPFRLAGILDRLNLAHRIKFNPEQADARRMNQLVDAYLANGAPCMVMMLHSSSLVPGCSPYVADQSRLDRLYRDLEATFEHCLSRRHMKSETLSGFAEPYLDATP